MDVKDRLLLWVAHHHWVLSDITASSISFPQKVQLRLASPDTFLVISSVWRTVWCNLSAAALTEVDSLISNREPLSNCSFSNYRAFSDTWQMSKSFFFLFSATPHNESFPAHQQELLLHSCRGGDGAGWMQMHFLWWTSACLSGALWRNDWRYTTAKLFSFIPCHYCSLSNPFIFCLLISSHYLFLESIDSLMQCKYM